MSFAFVIRKTAAEFTAENPVLELNQLGIVTDAGNATKVGNGTTAWNSLGYITPLAASPASGASGVAGTIAWDASYIYVCTGSGTWKRAALTGGY